MDIELLYKQIIEKSFYDEKYGMKPQIINGKKHGVCIDFSQELKDELLKIGIPAGIISTLTEDGFLHASVVYKDEINDKIYIADPVTDVRELTKLNDEERQENIEIILSHRKLAKKYH